MGGNGYAAQQRKSDKIAWDTAEVLRVEASIWPSG
jgi:hypothetical protein